VRTPLVDEVEHTSSMLDNTFGDFLRLLRTRRFGTFWFANLLSSIGTWHSRLRSLGCC
jgi:hypothetical protein